jgi:enoyl-CoA hydratase/carnithine racemase
MPLLYEKRGAVALLTFSRPAARNAWDEDYDLGLIERLGALERDEEVRCVILTGDEAGGAFCAGANLKDPNTHSTASSKAFVEGLPKWRKFVSNLLTEFPKPVIAAVNGYAVGIGCITTFSCDLIVASEKAEWRLPQVRLGILPAMGGSVRLARWVGSGNAMRAALGFPLKADEAHRIGLAQWLVPHEKLMEKAFEVANEIAAMPPLAVRLAKESMVRGQDMASLDDAALADTYRFMALELTEDAKAQHQAWRDRGKAVVRGR